MTRKNQVAIAVVIAFAVLVPVFLVPTARSADWSTTVSGVAINCTVHYTLEGRQADVSFQNINYCDPVTYVCVAFSPTFATCQAKTPLSTQCRNNNFAFESVSCVLKQTLMNTPARLCQDLFESQHVSIPPLK